MYLAAAKAPTGSKGGTHAEPFRQKQPSNSTPEFALQRQGRMKPKAESCNSLLTPQKQKKCLAIEADLQLLWLCCVTARQRCALHGRPGPSSAQPGHPCFGPDVLLG